MFAQRQSKPSPPISLLASQQCHPAALDPSTYGEGERFLGYVEVTTDSSGNASFSGTFPAAVPGGQFVSATATLLTDHDNNPETLPVPRETSEFSGGLLTEQVLNQAPIADAGPDQSAGEGSVMNFDGLGSSDPDGDALAYSWNFGDGAGTTGSTPTHVYADNGTYDVTLTVEDGHGLAHSDTLTVTVNNIAPTATLSNNGPVDEDSTVTVSFLNQFDPSSADSAAGFTYSYDFNDDGDFSDPGELENVTDPSASFTFAPGTYTVRGRIQDKDGGANEYTTNVTVNNLVDLSGRVFEDRNNNGLFDAGDVALAGVGVQLFNEVDLANAIATLTTDANGLYMFDVNLLPGTYRIVETQPDGGLLDGKESVGALGGIVDNTQASNIIRGIVVVAGDADADGYSFAEIPSARIQGLVWEDVDNDGEVDFGESAIAGVVIHLSGTNDRGLSVDWTMSTDQDGIYEFNGLRPGNYTVSEVQPLSFADGLDKLGTVNGVTTGSNAVDDVFSEIDFLYSPGADAVNYNFGERPKVGGAVEAGQTATIGFWQKKNGQSLIRSLNGGAGSVQLGSWLGATFSSMYSDLSAMTNNEIAEYYVSLFKRTNKTAPNNGPPKVDAQALAVALAVYVTNENLAGTTAAAYGFSVTQDGVRSSTINVGASGAAFGVEDGVVVTVLDVLLATNARTKNGLLYDLNGDGVIDSTESEWRTMSNAVFSIINQQGDI